MMKSLSLAIVGETNAGKSTLINSLCARKISAVNAKRHTTRRRVAGVRKSENFELIVVDTPGFSDSSTALSRLMIQQTQTAASMDKIALVVDVEKALSKRGYCLTVVNHLLDKIERFPDLVILNKVDLIKGPKVLEVIRAFTEVLPQSTEYFPLSAKKGDTEQLTSYLEEIAPQRDFRFSANLDSDQSEEFFISELLREKLTELLNAEVPHELGVRVEEKKYHPGKLKVAAVIFVAQNSQKPIVVGKGGEVLKKAGSRLRAELEELYGVKCYVTLHVKVQKNWHLTYAGLEEAGVLCQ